MNQRDEDAQQLIDRLSKGWDGDMTADERAELNQLLLDLGPDGGELLLNASTLHLQLGKHVAVKELYNRTMADIREIADHPLTDENLDEQPAAQRQPAQLAIGRYAYWGAAAAVLVAAYLGMQYLNAPPQAPLNNPVAVRQARLIRPTRPVATLVSSDQPLWGAGSNYEIGQNIQELTTLELQSGTAQLSLSCGADLVLQAPCSIELVAADRVRLHKGKVTAQVAQWATGFTVEANELEVVDLGTRFALSADDQGIVEAHVLEGEVLAEPLKQRLPQQAAMVLKSGQAIRVNPVLSSVDLIDARRDSFVDELPHFRPLRPISLWNTGVGAALGGQDPHWQITSGSSEYGPYPQAATITEGDTRSYEDNRPGISQWISVSEEGYPGVPPEAVHTFETRFDLTGFDPDTVFIVGYFLVDDAINELRINGHPVKFERWVTTWDEFDFKSFHPIEIADHFVAGENVISIDVYNSPSRPENPKSPNPTALRVEWQAFGCAE